MPNVDIEESDTEESKVDPDQAADKTRGRQIGFRNMESDDAAGGSGDQTEHKSRARSATPGPSGYIGHRAQKEDSTEYRNRSKSISREAQGSRIGI